MSVEDAVADAETVTEGAEQAALSMSDEAFMALDQAFLSEAPTDDEGEGDADDTDEQAPGTDADEDAGDTTGDVDTDPDSDDADPLDGDAEAGENESDDVGEPGDNDDVSDPDDEDAKDGDDTDPEVNTQDFFDAVTAEFTANGKSMKVESAADVVRLMQMGANYNKKMAGLKPNMKMLKTLENAGLLSEEKINFLIDIDQKNPQAIAKLLKDSKVDPMDFDLDQGDEYQANDYTADEREVELDSVVEELKDSPTYPKTINLVSKQWDADSKQVVANNPQLLKLIDGHMANGVYELISTEVERERVFGRLDGMSDIEAYRKIGDAIDERGGFAHLGAPAPKATEQRREVKPAPKKADTKRKSARRAASPAKAAPGSKAAQEFNPLSMSDEEYMKQFDPQLL